MKIKSLVLAGVASVAISGCMTGSNYVNQIDSKGFDIPSNMKEGKACTWFGMLGTSTIKEAAEKGNIKSVKYVETSVNPLRTCYIVYGY